jgi:cell division septation protein DedD
MLVKERLTGAIILVGLVVVLVPELLNGPIRPAARVRGPASAEEPPLRSYTINLADEPRGGSGTLALKPAGSSPPAPAAEPAARAAAPAAARTAATTPTSTTPASNTPTSPPPPLTARTTPAAPPPAAPATPGASGTGYVVQLGSFASRSNAQRLAKQVHGLGYTVSVSRGTSGRHLYRVRVGPARERAAAEQLAAQLRTQGHAGAVVAQ